MSEDDTGLAGQPIEDFLERLAARRPAPPPNRQEGTYPPQSGRSPIDDALAALIERMAASTRRGATREPRVSCSRIPWCREIEFPASLSEIYAHLGKHGISRESLTDQMGGSP